jgi:hypothetical protein
MAVAARGVGLPDLDERVAQRLAGAVEDAPGDDQPFADRLIVVLACQVVVENAEDRRCTERRAGYFGEALGQVDERLLGVAKPRRAILGRVERRMRSSRLERVRGRRVVACVVPVSC